MSWLVATVQDSVEKTRMLRQKAPAMALPQRAGKGVQSARAHCQGPLWLSVDQRTIWREAQGVDNCPGQALGLGQ